MNRKRRILYIHSYQGTQMAGSEWSLHDLIVGILEFHKNFRVVACVQHRSPLVARLKSLGVDVIASDATRADGSISKNPQKLRSFFLMTLDLGHIIKEKGIDLVHTNGWLGWEYSVLACRTRRIPCVLHHRGILSVSMDRFRKIKLGWVMRSAARVIANSEATKANLVSLGAETDKIVVVHNPVDLNRFLKPLRGKACIHDELSLDRDSCLIGVMGRIIESKGQDLLIKAAPSVLAALPKARFVIVGDAPEDKSTFNIARLKSLAKEYGVQDCFLFTGWREDVPELLHAFDLLVVPSRYEPAGRVIQEAMASKTPVIVSTKGGGPEFVVPGKSGLLFEPDKPDDLAKAIITVLRDLNYKKMGEEGYTIAQENFSIERHAERVVRVYEELLTQGR